MASLGTKMKWIACSVFVPMLIGIACSDDAVVPEGQCINDRTGEPLQQIRDVDGILWPVQRSVEELGSLTLEYCGVSVNVPLGGEASSNTDGEVYHPGTDAPIKVERPYRGIHKFAFPSGYSWD